MKKFVFFLVVFALFFCFSHANSYGEGSPDTGENYIQKWHGPGGYITLRDGKLYTPDGIIYYPSKKSDNKWHGPGGYITLRDGKLYTPNGIIYYPSNE